LSDADVAKIIDTFMATMKDLCERRIHCDCYGIGALKDLKAWFTVAEGCAGQKDKMEGAIINILLTLDDEWTTEDRRYPYPCWPFHHQDVKVQFHPVDNDDPLAIDYIILDPFRGCYTIVPATITSVTLPVTRCFTCDDFKKKDKKNNLKK
jgi:hypothetical protein